MHFHEWNGFFYILIKISLKFVPKGPIDNNPDNGLVPNRRQAIMLTRFTVAYVVGVGVGGGGDKLAHFTVDRVIAIKLSKNKKIYNEDMEWMTNHNHSSYTAIQYVPQVCGLTVITILYFADLRELIDFW